MTPTSAEIATTAREIVASHLGVPVDQISEESEIAALGADSLDLLAMVADAQDRFGIDIEDDAVDAINSPKTLAAAVEMALSAAAIQE